MRDEPVAVDLPEAPFTVSSTCHAGALAGVVAAHAAEATAKPAADAREMLSTTDDVLKILRFKTKPSNPAPQSG